MDPARTVVAQDSSAAPPIGRTYLEVALAIDVRDGSAVAKGAVYELARVVVIRDYSRSHVMLELARAVGARDRC